MRDDPAGDEFIQDLALAGHEGTVADRMHGTAAYGRCRTKTGTLTGVSNLSGYCFNRSGKLMIFSILMGSVRDLGLAHLEQDLIAGRNRVLLRVYAAFVVRPLVKVGVNGEAEKNVNQSHHPQGRLRPSS